MICCVRDFVDTMCKELGETHQEEAVYIKQYLDSLPKKIITFKKRDISDVVIAAINYEPLTRKEKAELLSECLKVIYNN